MPPSWRTAMRACILTIATIVSVAGPAAGQPAGTDGVAVSDPLVRAKCATCHRVDAGGSLRDISWARATPEGWQLVVQRMIREHDLVVTPAEARAIVKYLATRHGLAPAEARPVLYQAERRVYDEEGALDEALFGACGRCHAAAVALSWRRTADGWTHFTAAHARRYRFTPEPAVIARLAALAPFATPEWTAWSTRRDLPPLQGRWLLTAHVHGHGDLLGEMEVAAAPGTTDEFVTRVRLRSVVDGSEVVRNGRSVVYGGTAWRGRSQGGRPDGGSAPGDPASDARETLWIAPDGQHGEGRWFWGQYDEFGIDVAMRRPPAAAAAVLLVDPPALRLGTTGNRLRLLGEGLPVSPSAADLRIGAGVTVRRILSATATEIVAEIDVAAGAAAGARGLSIGPVNADPGIVLYDRIDYLRVAPESSLASFGSDRLAPGFQQFEAIGVAAGADGKPHTDDDLPLGAVPVTWSMEVFYDTDASASQRVGSISAAGFFTPAPANPGTNFDVWIVATATHERDRSGRPLVGKGYLVVTVPSYTFDGRTFVRDLGRWIEAAQGP